jgi:GTPase SAR1 family protein
MQYDDTPPRWQIAMLGSTSAGKTCYIGSFYGFYQVDTSGQQLNTSGFTVNGNAFTQGKLREIAEGLELNPPETPDPTKKIDDYKLFLRCSEEGELIERELHIHDHAGEALSGSSDPQKAEEFDKIIGRLKKSDAFIAFLDCSKILNSPSVRISKLTEWNNIHGVLTNVAARLGKGGDTLPVVLVLSKFDVAKTEDERRAILTYARKCADTLFDARNNITLLICPVSVLRESASGELERNLLNIPTPFLFVSAAIIVRNAAWHAEQADYHRQRAEAVQEKIRQNKEAMRGFFRGFLRRAINLRLQIGQAVSIDPAIGREVRLEENDLGFAEKALDYLVNKDNVKYTELIHRGHIMTISEYIDHKVRAAR